MRIAAVPALALALLAGCASTQLRVTYTSDPPGATLYQNGNPVGYTPYPMVYNDQRWQAGQCMRTLPISVQWASGASAGGEGLTFCPSEGSNLVYGFRRPDVAGREIDANFALQMHQASAAQHAANTQARSAAAMYMGYQLMNPPRPTFAPMQMPQRINCTSNRMGQYTYTNCH